MRTRASILQTRPGTKSLAFSLPELALVVAVLSLAACILVSGLLSSRSRSRQAVCTANLGKVNQAVIAFANENNQTLPGIVPGESGNLWWWYKEQVKRYAGLTSASSAGDTVFGCPEDRGYTDPIPFRLNARFDFTSYVFNGVTLPGMPSVAGLPVASVKHPRQTLLVMEFTAHAPLSWHRSRTGRKNAPFYNDAQSVVGFVDGHAAMTRIYYDGYNAAYTQDPVPGYDYQFSGN
jgi:type II secretory pathway pseudopilin PulG